MHIIGTAGHVDHGKSALVAALTGTHPDRWLEEQRRGMTLDLGFAHLVLEDGLEAGIVDVPGHERFLHNMLAGAAGMELLLLIIDANEGVMPQTIEHLEILRFLNVAGTIVVATKIDLVAENRRESALARIGAALHGTMAQDAPVVGVSSVTREGLDVLLARIAHAFRALPSRDASAPVYLPIDRVFALPGLGTVVTGTLMQGNLSVGEVLALEPSGKRARVRSLQVFGTACSRVGAGSRVAINVAGIDRNDIARGEVAVSREFSARSSFAVQFTPLESALPLLRRRTPVRVYLGSAELLGTLVVETVPSSAQPASAQLRLRGSTVAFPGVRFVVRRLSPKTLLGGGYVEGIEAEDAIAEGGATPAETALLAVLAERGLDPVDAGAAAYAANLREEAAREALDALVARDEAIAVRRPAGYVDAKAARELLAHVLAHLEQAHGAEPWSMGLTSIALARLLDVSEPLLVRLLAEFADAGRLAARAGYYATLDHRPALSAAQRTLFDSLVPAGDERSFVPVRAADVLSAVKRTTVPGAGKAFDTLLAGGWIVRVGGDLYLGSQIAQIRARVEEFLRRNERMTAAEFRDLLGTSRKYAVPLLEWMDAHGVTIRSGDHRMLRKRAP